MKKTKHFLPTVVPKSHLRRSIHVIQQKKFKCCSKRSHGRPRQVAINESFQLCLDRKFWSHTHELIRCLYLPLIMSFITNIFEHLIHHTVRLFFNNIKSHHKEKWQEMNISEILKSWLRLLFKLQLFRAIKWCTVITGILTFTFSTWSFTLFINISMHLIFHIAFLVVLSKGRRKN